MIVYLINQIHNELPWSSILFYFHKDPTLSIIFLEHICSFLDLLYVNNKLKILKVPYPRHYRA